MTTEPWFSCCPCEESHAGSECRCGNVGYVRYDLFLPLLAAEGLGVSDVRTESDHVVQRCPAMDFSGRESDTVAERLGNRAPYARKHPVDTSTEVV